MKGHRGNPGLKGRLVDKSIEGYILALETINRLSIQYRVETFRGPPAISLPVARRVL